MDKCKKKEYKMFYKMIEDLRYIYERKPNWTKTYHKIFQSPQRFNNISVALSRLSYTFFIETIDSFYPGATVDGECQGFLDEDEFMRRLGIFFDEVKKLGFRI